MKIGVLVPENSPDLKTALTKCAAAGADGVQFYIRTPHYDLMEASGEELEAIRGHLRSLQLELPAVCGELSGHGFQRENEVQENQKRFLKILDVAERLQAPVVSTHIGVIPANDATPVYRTMLNAVTAIGREAQKRGIAVAIETGPELPYILRKFIERTEGGVGVNLDAANLAMVHDIDAFTATLELQGHILHVHAKDGIHCRPCNPEEVYGAFADGGFDALVARTGELFREVPLGEGQVNFPRFLSALRQVGYQQYLTIEREVGNDPFADIRKAVAFLHDIQQQRSFVQ